MLADLLSPEAFNQHYLSLFFELCEDQVAEVRLTACLATLSVVRLLAPLPEYFEEFQEKVNAFKSSKKFSMRQVYVQMCASCLKDEEIFSKYFMAGFASLQTDRIVNVRLCLSASLSKLFRRHEVLQQVDEVENGIKVIAKTTKTYKGSALCGHETLLDMVNRL